MAVQLLDSKFLGYWVLETVMLSLTKVQVNMRDVGRVEMCVHAVVGHQGLGLLGDGDSVVGPDQGADEYEGGREGGAVCLCSCWAACYWAIGC